MSGCLPGVSLQELHYVWMFQHVAYCGFSVNKVVSLSLLTVQYVSSYLDGNLCCSTTKITRISGRITIIILQQQIYVLFCSFKLLWLGGLLIL